MSKLIIFYPIRAFSAFLSIFPPFFSAVTDIFSKSKNSTLALAKALFHVFGRNIDKYTH